MMIVPAGVKVHLALGYTDMRKGMDGQADAGPGRAEQGSILGPPFCFPGQARIDIEDPVLGREWTVPVHQTH